MDYCCQRFEEAVKGEAIVRAEVGATSAWLITSLGSIDYCPFCGNDIKYFIEPVEELPDMDSLEGLLRRIGEAAYFTGVEVTAPNTLGLFGTTPLHIAATWGDCEAIKMLAEAGADLDVQGEYDFTPLMEAVSQGNDEAVRLLVELGAKPVANEDGQSPSEFAALLQHDDLSTFLREKGF